MQRLVDYWTGGTTRDPAAVVAEHRARCPVSLLARKPKLTKLEQRLWRWLGDREWMGVDVFPLVPVHVPEAGFGCFLTFFVPRFACALELSYIDWRSGDIERILDDFEEHAARDDLLREHAGIATMRLTAQQIAKDERQMAEVVRWNFGLADGDGLIGLSLPRRRKPR